MTQCLRVWNIQSLFRKQLKTVLKLLLFLVAVDLLVFILQCTDLLLVVRQSGGTCALCVHCDVAFKQENGPWILVKAAS